MASVGAGSGLRSSLDTLARVGVVGDLADGPLLRRVAADLGGDVGRSAFAAVVERHGPMVWSVCRRVLGDTPDAQDAFQATFLVLARKAGSVRKADSLASWLHGVALRVARRARVDDARRLARERRGAELRAVATSFEPDPEPWPELHEEIARLPGRYREPLVLCYLEGLSTEAAASRIGCPRGTILSRLSRARDRLRDGLTRRGLAPSLVPAAGSIPQAFPATWLDATVKASLAFAERRAGGAVLATAATTTLAQGVLTAMTLSKLKLAGAAALALALAATGVRTYARQQGGDKPGPTASTANDSAAKAEPKAADRSKLTRQADDLLERFARVEVKDAALQKEKLDLQKRLSSLLAAVHAADKSPAAAKTDLPAPKEDVPPTPAKGSAFRERLALDLQADDLRRQLAAIEAQVDPLEEQRLDLQKQLSSVLAAISAARNAPAASKPEAPAPKAAVPPTPAKPAADDGLVVVRNTAKGPGKPAHFPWTDRFLVVIPKEESRAVLLDTRTNATKAVRLAPANDGSVKVSPIFGPGVLALGARGPKISRVAVAAVSRDGGEAEWSVQELREPVDGVAIPFTGNGVAAYALGRYVYAYGWPARRWGTLELPEGAKAAPVVRDVVVKLEWGGHVCTFDGRTGRWTDLDLNAILKTAAETEPNDPAPKD